MRAKTKIYHMECFKCDACQKNLRPGDEFALRQDGLFCKEDHEELSSKSINNENNNNNNNITNNNNNTISNTNSNSNSSIHHHHNHNEGSNSGEWILIAFISLYEYIIRVFIYLVQSPDARDIFQAKFSLTIAVFFNELENICIFSS